MAETNTNISISELVRIVLQSLQNLGYTSAASTLEQESGISLDSPSFSSLLSHSLTGRFNLCSATLDSITNLNSNNSNNDLAKFIIHKQHFLELLGSNDPIAARSVLANQISPLDEISRRRINDLTKTIVTGQGAVVTDDLMKGRINMLLNLIQVLPASVRVPAGRLERLVEMALSKQIEGCLYHNFPDEVSLYKDHRCGRERIPSECSQTLYDHKNEVWFVQFSNGGEYLASSSKDCTAMIWKVEEEDTLLRKHVLEGHRKPVSFIAWSPDDTMLLTCGNGEVVKLWDVNTGTCMHTFRNPVNRVISSCAWFPNSAKIVCSSCQPNSRIYTCDLEGNELEVWEGERIPKVSHLAVTPDGNNLISICSDREIWIHSFLRGKERVISEESFITSLSLSSNGQFMIVNLNSEEIHLWSLHETSTQPHSFRGHKQGNYVIRSCFGGTDGLFIASGSEDCQVYIWQRNHEMPIQVLSGHSSTVNCVSWNPMRPYMLVSGSDDGTICIWLAAKRCSTLSQDK